LRPQWTVAEALEHLRQNPPAGRVIYFYVVAEDGTLLGVVPTRRLLLNAPTAPIRAIMVKATVAVPAQATLLEACEFFSLHRLLAAILSGIFQDALSWQNAVLALFVPVVLALAESVTIQSVTITLQGMRVSTASAKRLMKSLVAEAGTGLMLGICTAVLVTLVA